MNPNVSSPPIVINACQELKFFLSSGGGLTRIQPGPTRNDMELLGVFSKGYLNAQSELQKAGLVGRKWFMCRKGIASQTKGI